MAAGTELSSEMVTIFLAHHDVDATAEGSDAPSHELGGREELDTLHHGDVDGNVEEEMACLGVGEVDAVEEDDHLVEGASAHGEVALHIVAAAGAEVDAWQQGDEDAK